MINVVPLNARAQGNDPSLTIRNVVRGTERTPEFSYQFDVVCTHNIESLSPVVRITLPRNQAKTLTKAEIPNLSVEDTCRVKAVDNNGAETSYLSSQPDRTDGTRQSLLPGLLDVTGFRSAPTRANGQTITVTNTFSGDLILALRVEGTPPSTLSSQEMFLVCEKAGISRSFSLANGEREVVTGIPAGSECQASVQSASGASVRYEDTSGNPNDAIVTIIGTRSECLDLRVASPDCRAQIIAITSFNERFDATKQNDNTSTSTSASTSSTTSTTIAKNEDQNQNPQSKQKSQADAPLAAPAVEAAPAIPLSGNPTFTG